MLPAGLVYVNGSTTVGGAPTTIDAITTGGLSLGSMGPQQEIPVIFRVLASRAQLPLGVTQTQIGMVATADTIPQISGQLTVVATCSQAGTVPTGPGDAVVAALLVSAIMTLLYVSYTHTAAYRRREVEAIAHGKDPMDFRS